MYHIEEFHRDILDKFAHINILFLLMTTAQAYMAYT